MTQRKIWPCSFINPIYRGRDTRPPDPAHSRTYCPLRGVKDDHGSVRPSDTMSVIRSGASCHRSHTKGVLHPIDMHLCTDHSSLHRMTGITETGGRCMTWGHQSINEFLVFLCQTDLPSLQISCPLLLRAWPRDR